MSALWPACSSPRSQTCLACLLAASQLCQCELCALVCVIVWWCLPDSIQSYRPLLLVECQGV